LEQATIAAVFDGESSKGKEVGKRRRSYILLLPLFPFFQAFLVNKTFPMMARSTATGMSARFDSAQ
jgi:hypothetical protein